MIYFIKPELTKLRNTLSKSTNGGIGSMIRNGLFKSLILTCHHLFMFSMQDEVFPNRYDADFPYSTFMETEQFKVDKNMKVIAEHIWELLARF